MFNPEDTLNNYNLDIGLFIDTFKQNIAKWMPQEAETYLKLVTPLQWIKDLLNENKVFDDLDEPIQVKSRFYELTFA
jgi:hypothetical protein